VIESNRVSREHCRIAREGADYVLEDLNSSNGTFFGPSKEKVTRRKIKDGDEFTLGTEKIRFQIRK
jgi:pSer/pThr/pTyr-binding forkhead associated (FHA) protein